MNNDSRLEQRLRNYLAGRAAEPAPVAMEQRILQQVLERNGRVSSGRWGARQLIGTAVVIVLAIGLGIAIVHALSQAPAPVQPAPSTLSFAPRNLKMVTPTIGWAGSGSAGFRTTDGGLHWRSVAPPPLPDQTKGGVSSFVLDANHAWMTRATGPGPVQPVQPTQLVTLATADGGQSWKPGVPVPVRGTRLFAWLGFIDAQHGWLLMDSDSGSSSGRTRALYATRDGGLHWDGTASASEGGRSALGMLATGCLTSGVTFITLDTGWITWDCGARVEQAGAPPSGPVVTATTDGGRSWQPVVLPSYPSGADWICGAQPPVFTRQQGVLPVRCIGHPGWQAVYTTADGGRTWSVRQLPFFSQRPLTFIDATTGWAVSQGSGGADVYRTSDGGRAWTRLSRIVSDVDDFQFVDDKHGFASASDFFGNEPPQLLKTTDGGNNWSVLKPVLVGGQP